jgi:RES domain-containing protein
MLVYRISKKEYIEDLSGIGAALFGGRWNPKSYNLVYTAGNIALAYVEFLVHNYHILKKTHVCLACIKLPDAAEIKTIDINELPSNWGMDNNYLRITQEIGKTFVSEAQNYILKVPSVVVPGEFNYLLNPSHKLHLKTKIQEIIDPFKYDPRLLNRN